MTIPSMPRRSSLAAAIALVLTACGGASDESAQRENAATRHAQAAPQALRLTPNGMQLKGPNGQTVRLHGANLRDNLDSDGNASTEILSESEADDIAHNLSFNFVRLRLSVERGNRDDSHPSGLSAPARQALDGAIRLLSARKVWILLEMRTDDATANSAALYDPNSPVFQRYRDTWTWLAQTYRNTDYIAGYGLLAEPSPDRAPGKENPVEMLVRFQSALMQAIQPIDARTPLFVGPAFNYDTMGYRWDRYYDDGRFADFRGRMVYEVNLLMPKPWIQDGSVPPDVPTAYRLWPQPTVSDFSSLLEVKDGEKFLPGRDDEKIFNARRVEPDNFRKLMSREFPAWYLDYAHQFALRHQVPVVVDQFGASTAANDPDRPAQQLRYEQAVIDAAEGYGMGWSRWIYSANPQERSIVGNPAVRAFYVQIGQARPGP